MVLHTPRATKRVIVFVLARTLQHAQTWNGWSWSIKRGLMEPQESLVVQLDLVIGRLAPSLSKNCMMRELSQPQNSLSGSVVKMNPLIWTLVIFLMQVCVTQVSLCGLTSSKMISGGPITSLD